MKLSRILILNLLAAALCASAFPPVNVWFLLPVGLTLHCFIALQTVSFSYWRAFVVFFSFKFFCYALGFYWVCTALNSLFLVPITRATLLTISLFALLSICSGLIGILWVFLTRKLQLKFGFRQSYFSIVSLSAVLILLDAFDPKIVAWSFVIGLGTNKYLLASVGVISTWGWRLLLFPSCIIAAWFIIDFCKRYRSSSLVLALSPIVAVLCIGLGCGYLRIRGLQNIYKERQPVALVQDNVIINQGQLSTLDGVGTFKLLVQLFNHHEGLLSRAARRLEKLFPADKRKLWVVWPETSIIDNVIGGERAGRKFQTLSKRLPGLHFLGTNEVREVQGHFGSRYNIIALVDSDNGYQGHYRKIIRFPFGEYIPGEQLFPSLVKELYHEHPEISVAVVGTELTTLKEANPTPQIFLPFICFEIIFEDHVREFVKEASAKYGDREIVLVNSAKDSWFGDTSEPELHSLLARWNSASVGLPLLRASNTGLTQVVAPWGEVLYEAPRNLTTVLFGELPVKSAQLKAAESKSE